MKVLDRPVADTHYETLHWLIGSAERDGDLTILAVGLFEVQNLSAVLLFKRRDFARREVSCAYFYEKNCDPVHNDLALLELPWAIGIEP